MNMSSSSALAREIDFVNPPGLNLACERRGIALRISRSNPGGLRVEAGPYLVVPLLQPLTVRDAFGYAADSFMDPLSLFLTPIGVDVARSAAYTINERAVHMTEFDDVEDTSLDLYAAVRNGYLQRRQRFIEDSIPDRDRSWESIARGFDEGNED